MKTRWIEVGHRLLKEFWVAALLSLAWTTYYIFTNSSWHIKDTVTVFGTSFFLFSWFSGQFIRVKKQSHVEQSFEQIIDTITGGKTFPFVNASEVETQRGVPGSPHQLWLSPQGSHSIYDLVVVVTDIEAMRQLHASGHNYQMSQYQQQFQLGTLGRGYEEQLMDIHRFGPERFILEPPESFTFHIQSFARNGQFNQRLLLRKIGNRWLWATRIVHDSKVVHEFISPQFPTSALTELDPTTPLLI